jgi:hypothetical protein
MATTRFVLTPESAHLPTSNFAVLSKINARPVLLFDASTDETAYWTIIGPQGLTGALSAKIHYICSNATSGTAAWDVAIEAITDGDSTDLDATTSFATVNGGTGTVPGTNGYIDVISITLTNDDSIAAADYVRVSVARDTAADSVANDLALLAVEIQEA